jgi:flotillin
LGLFGTDIEPWGPLGIALLSVAGAVGLLVLFWFIQRFLFICPPNMVLIFSGRRHRMPDGSHRGFRVVFGGRGWRMPFFETVSRVSLSVMEVPIGVRSAYSKGGIALNVDAIANVKISSDPMIIGNAIERFLGRDPEEIRRVAKETLEGHLRGVLAKLTPEEVNEDRLKFAAALSHESEEDFSKLGIHVDTLKILHVSDEVKYLNSIGRQAIASIVRDAEIAESDAKRDAELAEAENLGRAKVKEANVEAAIAQMQNDLRRVKAELEAQVQAEEERTKAAAREARAKAEQELQQVRAELETLRLRADAVLPAEAEQEAQVFISRGEAASIREQGQAASKALEALQAAWSEAGDAALRIYLIEDLEKILQTVAAGVSKVKIANLNMIDDGSGEVFSSYVSAYPAMLSSLFDAIAKTTGIDIPKVISGTDEPVKGGRT